ncbi:MULTISPECIES: serine hydrolase [unclassified Robiginitalea]|uniref:serine hydrolase n=1 Tax=Robiginitalea TaxID=252306 RepID=UPI00234A10C7|nr:MULTISPECIES: serine hydrolase [unclassified Robiginitalea]MDC6355368.1 serine hydrolase [Robiginitalea sp. PM2]MDC6375417.1 serine hydrolase [Robiginitalea sp. SP8]
MTLGENLIYQRKKQGLSQEELAGKTQVTVRTIQRIEKGDVNPHLQTVKLLAAALSVEVEDLMPIDNPREETIQAKWLLLIHATPLLGLFIPFLNVLLPLFLWIHKREDHPLYYRHGAQVINFQITVLLLYLASFAALLTWEGYGFVFFITVIPLCIAITFANIIYALRSRKCFYPAIPFLGSGRKKTLKTILLAGFALTTQSLPAQGQALAGHWDANHRAGTIERLDGIRRSKAIERLDGSRITAAELTRQIKELAEAGGVTGLAVAVFNEATPVYQETFGYRDAPRGLHLEVGSNMYGASLSKAVFAVLVMKLIEEGVIDLDTPLESYLPKKIHEYTPQTKWHDDYSDLEGDTVYPAITARMCLAHTSGFPNWRWFEPDQKLRVHGTPGEEYRYSGEGLVYLQVVLEKITGQPLEELAREHIFKPLGMSDTAYLWKEPFARNYAVGHRADGTAYKKDTDNEPRSASTLETTPADYTRFLEGVLKREILQPESWGRLFSRQIRIRSVKQFGEGAREQTDRYDGIGLGYAMGWGYLETPHGPGLFKEGHGNGFQHYTIVFPRAGKGMMILANSDNAEGIFRDLLHLALKDTYTPWRWEGYIPFYDR